eukprot:6489725-Amphidinium_carterae.1
MSASYSVVMPQARARVNLLCSIHDLYIASPNCTQPNFSHTQGACLHVAMCRLRVVLRGSLLGAQAQCICRHTRQSTAARIACALSSCRASLMVWNGMNFATEANRVALPNLTQPHPTLQTQTATNFR